MLNIFISDLGRYNAGELTGKWYDMETEEGREEAAQAVADIEENGSGEYFISDYESDWADISASIGGFEEIAEVMAQVDELNETDKEIFKAVYSLEMYDMDDILRIVRDCEYIFVDVEEWAKTLEDPFTNLAKYYVDSGLIEVGGIAERYFDYEKFGRDLELNGATYAEVTDGYIFLDY